MASHFHILCSIKHPHLIYCNSGAANIHTTVLQIEHLTYFCVVFWHTSLFNIFCILYPCHILTWVKVCISVEYAYIQLHTPVPVPVEVCVLYVGLSTDLY